MTEPISRMLIDTSAKIFLYRLPWFVNKFFLAFFTLIKLVIINSPKTKTIKNIDVRLSEFIIMVSGTSKIHLEFCRNKDGFWLAAGENEHDLQLMKRRQKDMSFQGFTGSVFPFESHLEGREGLAYLGAQDTQDHIAGVNIFGRICCSDTSHQLA